ncbi:alpha/beta-hydrolase [Microthyrium microscopicum]|uniref:1-alkyl-2-acetylglycerophosphocholine esterase n=1 Tax=Microthyrium microscopicum TaxID=703497 RepID=A0A6A6U706_9PEZI|nr:alpha/beta-hydrolase [Microthyrium microscopicum]
MGCRLQALPVSNLLIIFISYFALIVSSQDNGAPFSFGARLLEPCNPPVMTANATGKHRIGIRRETLSFDNRQLNVSWWYPGTPASGSKPHVASGGIYGQAVRDAPLDRSNGPYPLIVFSPGVGARDDSYYFYCQNLASHGYTVVSINHLDSTQMKGGGISATAMMQAAIYMLQNNSSYTVWLLFSNWFRSTHFALTYRPQEIDFVLSKAIAANTDPSSPFFGAIDTENIGLTGHSLGAFYTLLKGGGFAINCDFPLTAKESDVNNTVLTEVNICAWPEAKRLNNPKALHNSRIKAIVPLAAPVFIKPSEVPRGASSIETPMLIMTGNDPKFESTIEPQQQIFDAAKGPKYMVQIRETDHMMISEAYHFNKNFSAGLPSFLATNQPTANTQNFTEKAQIYMEYSAAFFDVYLKKNVSSKEKLRTKSSDFVAKQQYFG